MASTTSFPLLRLGRIQLDPRLRALRPGTDASDLVVTAAVPVPDSPGEVQYFWEIAWNDAVRQAGELGAAKDTAQALSVGSGDAQEHGPGTRVVIAAHGQVLHEQWLGQSVGENSVVVGPLPHLAAAASAAAARPACVVVVADRDGADVIAHASGTEVAVEHFLVGKREPSQTGHVREKPPAVHHGERHLTDSEPESGGQANATEVAARIDDAAAKVGAHIVLGAGDQHILDAVSAHLTGSLGPIITIDGRRTRSGRDDHMGPAIGAALDRIAVAATSEIGDRIASQVGGENPGAVRGVKAVAEQLAEQQVAVLLLAADIARDSGPSNSYVLGSSPTELLPANVVTGLAVPLEDGLVWAALHQDAIVVVLPDRAGPLAGEPAAALLRRGQPRDRQGGGLRVTN
jgi:Bacterial archaeo-eukaryotic release factor family 2